MAKTRIGVVGAGPGGLTAAMILAHRGLDVTVFEQNDYVGGRNSTLKLGDYRFDLGPTFLMMGFILEEVFDEAGKRASDYLELVKLEPMYRLQFDDFALYPTTDPEKMREEIRTHFPGSEDGLEKFMAREGKRFAKMLPCLQKDYSTAGSMVSGPLLKALPYLSMHRKLFGVLGDYFEPEKLRLSFTFQSKYLGMSPWTCPAAFGILSYIEHAFGVYHTIGGLSRISETMADVVRENGGRILTSSPVKEVVVKDGAARGVVLQSGERYEMDAASPVRWCEAWRMRYMTGSRRLRLGWAMSILARRVREPSGNSPARIRRNRSRFSSTERPRVGLFFPGSVSVPRYLLISSAFRSQT